MNFLSADKLTLTYRTRPFLIESDLPPGFLAGLEAGATEPQMHFDRTQVARNKPPQYFSSVSSPSHPCPGSERTTKAVYKALTPAESSLAGNCGESFPRRILGNIIPPDQSARDGSPGYVSRG